MRERSRSRGFTLIEMMIVVAIIAVIAGIIAINYARMEEKARLTASEASMKSIASAVEMYYSDTRSYPTCSNVDSSCFGSNNVYLPTVPLVQGQQYIFRVNSVAGFKIKDPTTYDSDLLAKLTNWTTGAVCGTGCSGVVYTETGGLEGYP